jgi:K+-sensing histidine kinase KdpD
MFNTDQGHIKKFTDRFSQSGNRAEGGISCDDKNILSCPKILTGLSHEVRTYMNSIVAFSFLQSNENCNLMERKEYSDHILNSCEQLITLFDNFLDSAMLDSESPKTNLKKSQLGIFMQNLAIDLNNSLSKLDRNQVSLVLEEIPSDYKVYLEEEKVIRVLKNLFQNAIEHTSSGYVKLGYKRDDKRVIFYVIDSGSGYHLNKQLLSGEELQNLLGKNNNTFAAIGLILAQKLISSMGGNLWIEPNGVNGSAIYFSVQERKIFEDVGKEEFTIKSRIAI